MWEFTVRKTASIQEPIKWTFGILQYETWLKAHSEDPVNGRLESSYGKHGKAHSEDPIKWTFGILQYENMTKAHSEDLSIGRLESYNTVILQHKNTSNKTTTIECVCA